MESDLVMPQEFRDSVFRTLKHEAENLTCFQCGNKNPKWASVTMGLLICYNCTSFHRSLGTHLSFVRSADLDKWSRRQLAFMELGGNKRAKEFFRRHGPSTTVDFSSPLAERYRVELEEKVSQLYPKRKEESPVLDHLNSSPIPIIETVKSELPILKLEPIPGKPQVPMTTELKKTPVIHVAPAIPQATPTYKFRKTKAAAAPAQFKAVVFHPEEEDEFQECNPSTPATSSVSTPTVASVTPTVQRPNPTSIIEKGPSIAQVQPTPPRISEKKSFSSEDFQSVEDAYVNKERLSRFSTSKSISSDAYFGRETEMHSEQPTFEDEASRLANLASEKAHELKEKAMGFYHSLASRFA